ncbi:hypothetical protein [Frankia sp. AgKG'84/4]|uniref:hypothetical protein n=1 Tax=Frankia sp. AgKG'84/4 TaxID=573490 RepID=UPI0020101F64|nr:hypothetical protein [Frankia sp. AgKG'84/4]MCL9794969.1 hypothetical protein [Frankia sp. AgKG'84/4]
MRPIAVACCDLDVAVARVPRRSRLGPVRRRHAAPTAATLNPVAVASLSDNIPDGWRTVGPYAHELAALDQPDRRVLVTGGLSVGVYAAAFATAFATALGAHVDYVDTDRNASPPPSGSAPTRSMPHCPTRKRTRTRSPSARQPARPASPRR